MMRGRELKALRLPQLIEQARARGDSNSLVSSPQGSPNRSGHSQQFSSSSTVSATDIPSPTFSLRGHSRFGSSSSSLASSPPLRESMDGFAAGKRPLTEVKEAPQEEEFEESQMIDNLETVQESTERHFAPNPDLDWSLDDPQLFQWSDQYLGSDAFDNDFSPNPVRKRQRSSTSPSPFNGLTSRMTHSISRKWRPRKVTPPFPGQDVSRDPSLSRANSTRAPSFASATLESNSLMSGHPLPSTPTKSAQDEGFTDFNGTYTDSLKDDQDHFVDAEEQAKPATPLLPPIMTHPTDDINDIPYQSPLQSPSVAERDPPSAMTSPLPTPQLIGLPSPPLSSKPSTASFQRQRGCQPAVSSPEIPPMLITDPDDDNWGHKLGHADFTIYPEPYEPRQFDLEACRQLRTDWEVACRNFAKHLIRTGDNYSPNSRIYRLTEEKWIDINSKWNESMAACFSQATKDAPESKPFGIQSDIKHEPPPLIKMPSLNGPKSEGKFPKMGDEGIVGPMEVVAPPALVLQQQHQPPPSRKKRKLGFFRWVQGVWPVGVGVFGRGSTSGP